MDAAEAVALVTSCTSRERVSECLCRPHWFRHTAARFQNAPDESIALSKWLVNILQLQSFSNASAALSSL